MVYVNGLRLTIQRILYELCINEYTRPFMRSLLNCEAKLFRDAESYRTLLSLCRDYVF
nr:hypothetical protein [uncultured bacterium]